MRRNRTDRARARILGAAERVFATAGYAGARMAEIAAASGLPKANLHYHFKTKECLYRAVLDDILGMWLAATDQILPDSDPSAALAGYIRRKMVYSRTRPDASKVFANEILHGAPQIGGFLGAELRALVAAKSAVIEGWIARGLMAPVEPRHLFFVLWAMTQTYADFEVQIRAVLGRRRLGAQDFQAGAMLIERLVLLGCGLSPAPEQPPGRTPPAAPDRPGSTTPRRASARSRR
ncbi:MAG: TetR/AcrR family transcriptional regulator [Acetobacteraceae bacterium]